MKELKPQSPNGKKLVSGRAGIRTQAFDFQIQPSSYHEPVATSQDTIMHPSLQIK